MVSGRIVLRGPHGFVGSAFYRAFTRACTPFQVLTRENRDSLEPGGIDLLIDAGGSSRKYLAERDPARDRAASVDAVADALSHFRPRRYLLLSSSAVYADPSSPETTREVDEPTGPVSVYGAHKREAEERVRAACANALVLRPAGFFGPGLAKGPVYDLLEARSPHVDPASRMQLLPVDAFVSAALQLAAAGGTFNAVPAGSVVLAEAFPQAVARQRARDPARDRPRLSFGMEGRRFGEALDPRAGDRRALEAFVTRYRAREARSAVAVLVLAGGQGTRLPGDEPKPIRPVAGVPLVQRVARPFLDAGYRQFVLALGHEAARVNAALEDDPVLGRAPCVVEAEPLGTGGALRHALDRIAAETVLVVNGDTLFQGIEVEALVKRHVRMSATVTLLAAQVADASRFGLPVVADDGRLVAFEEKTHAGPGWVHAGVLVVDRARFMSAVGRARPASLERDLLPALARSHAVHVMRAPGVSFLDAGTPEGFRAAEDQVGGR